ncbi:hypothetical protein MASR2M36_36290 [Providencia sp.]
MFSISELINDSPIDSILLFVITFILLVISAYVGKYIFKRKSAHEEATDDEAKIILGAILSLLGLLMVSCCQFQSMVIIIANRQKKMKPLQLVQHISGHSY